MGQDIPERLARRTERNSADEAAIAAAQLDAHMPAAADLPRLDHPVLREHEDRLGLPLAERTCPLERAHHGRLGAGRGQGGVDSEIVPQRVALTGSLSRSVTKA